MRSRCHNKILLVGLLVTATVVLSLALAVATLYSFGTHKFNLWLFSTPKRYAVVQFVDESDEYLWGVYSTHVQLNKFGMTPHNVQHVAMVSHDISPKSRQLLTEWLGPTGIIEFDRDYIIRKLTGDETLRQGVFLKLQAFNLTQFDKLIVLDNDVFVRQSLIHWFDYPTPAATGSRGMMEWNSGAMVIEPNTSLFHAMMDYLPKTKRYNIRGGYKGTDDPWNSLGGQQGFMSAFFASNVTDDTVHTMSYLHSVLSSDLDDRPENEYYWRHRPDVFQTVHFTKHKMWKGGSKTSNPVTCAMLHEWAESVMDAPKKRLPKLGDFLRNCPPQQAPPLQIAKVVARVDDEHASTKRMTST